MDLTLAPMPLLDARRLFAAGIHSAQVGDMTVVFQHANTQKDQPLGQLDDPTATSKPMAICLHWGATTWNVVYDDYHITCVFNPVSRQAYIVVSVDFLKKGQHLLGRNSGILGACFAAMEGAQKGGWQGRTPVQPEQVELLAIFLAELCCVWGINPMDSFDLDKKTLQGERLVNVGGTVPFDAIHDHAYAAKEDGYPNDRWDIDVYYGQVRDRLIQIYHELKGAASGVKMDNGEARVFLFKDFWGMK